MTTVATKLIISCWRQILVILEQLPPETVAQVSMAWSCQTRWEDRADSSPSMAILCMHKQQICINRDLKIISSKKRLNLLRKGFWRDKGIGIKQGNNLGSLLLPKKSLFLTLTLREPPHPHQNPARKYNPVFSLPSMSKKAPIV